MEKVEGVRAATPAAEAYEELLVPALFSEWAPRVASAARIAAGDRVLDVACGTGVLARHVAERVLPGGSITGIDADAGMLAVAARVAPRVEWRQGKAEMLPFASGSFDVVVSQFGLTSFEDPRAALREMARVLVRGGRLALAVWDALPSCPAYAELTAIVDRLFGARAGAALRARFRLGDVASLRALLFQSGLPSVQVMTRGGTARFASMRGWLLGEMKGWALDEILAEGDRERLLEEAERRLSRFVTREGGVTVELSAHIAIPRAA